MGDESKIWRKSVGVGCGVLVLLPVVILAVVSVRTALPLKAAKQDLAQLEALYGPPGSFEPAADGAIAPERLEVFLGVREAMAGQCATFSDMMGSIRRIESTTSDPDPSAGEVAETTRDVAGVATRITPFVGEFLKARNRALLDAGIGLGEYSYIYALAYRDRLLDPALRSELFSKDSPLAPQAHDALRSMLALQRDSLSAIAPLSLAAEIAAMQQDPMRLPWAGALPDTVATSLAPFRDRLESGYCDGLAGIELDRDPRRALRIALE